MQESMTKDTMGESREATQNNYKEIQENMNDILKQVKDIKGELSKEKENIKKVEENIENVIEKIVTEKQMLVEPSGIKPKCIIKSLCGEFAKEFQAKTKERKKTKEKSAYLSAEDIYDEFRKESGAILAPCSQLLRLMIGLYFISVLVLGIVTSLLYSQDSMQYISQNFKMAILFFEPIVLLVVLWSFCAGLENKIEVKYSEAILFIWICSICWPLFLEFPSKFLFLINHFFLSIYMISIIEYNSKNYSDDERKIAITRIEEILSGNSFNVKEAYIYDLLASYSASIEDTTVLIVKKLIKYSSTAGFILVVIFNDKIEEIKKIFDIGRTLKEQDFVTVITMQIWIVNFLFTIFVFIFLTYKCLNWKADFYREVLKDKQFLLAKNKVR